jgi:hypothetical protein
MLDPVDPLCRVRALNRIEARGGGSLPSVNGERLATHLLCGATWRCRSPNRSASGFEDGPRMSSNSTMGLR